jgi:hypothetical protein
MKSVKVSGVPSGANIAHPGEEVDPERAKDPHAESATPEYTEEQIMLKDFAAVVDAKDRTLTLCNQLLIDATAHLYFVRMVVFT